MPERPPSAEFHGREHLDLLFQSVTVDQLRTALAGLARGTSRASRRSKATLQEAVLETGRNLEDIRGAIYRTEALTPAKHFVLQVADRTVDFATLDKLRRGSDDSKQLHLSNVLRNGEHAFLTYEERLEVTDYVPIEADLIRKVTRPIRQPFVVRLTANRRTVLISYPGTTALSGRRHPTVNYETTVKRVLDLLCESLAIAVEPLPVQRCITSLEKAGTRRFRVVARKSNLALGGRLSITSPDQRTSAEEALRMHFQKYLRDLVPPDLLQTALSRAAHDVFSDYLVLAWAGEKIRTRIQFWATGPEFLVVWDDEQKSFAAVDGIVSLFEKVAAEIDPDSRNGLWDRISATPDGELLWASSLADTHDASAATVREAIGDAIQAGLLEPVFRLARHEELAEPLAAQWTAALASLARSFVLASGEVVDGRDPREVQIAFRRVRGSVGSGAIDQ
jgi:hypothetical protein